MRKQSRICQDFTSMNNLKLQKIGKITRFRAYFSDGWLMHERQTIFFNEQVVSTNKMKLGMCKGG